MRLFQRNKAVMVEKWEEILEPLSTSSRMTMVTKMTKQGWMFFVDLEDPVLV